MMNSPRPSYAERLDRYGSSGIGWCELDEPLAAVRMQLNGASRCLRLHPHDSDVAYLANILRTIPGDRLEMHKKPFREGGRRRQSRIWPGRSEPSASRATTSAATTDDNAVALVLTSLFQS